MKLNSEGTGRGLKTVTRPVTKSRGGKSPRGAANRAGYTSLSNIPVTEIAAIPPEDLSPLTDKAKLFVKYWAEGDSITSAALRAGYGDGATYAYKLTHRADVKALYAAEKAKYAEAAQLSRVDVMNMLKESYDMAKLMSEPATMVSAAREIGKMCGYYEPKKVDLNVNVNGQIAIERMSKMSEQELLDIIAKAASEDEDDTPAPLEGPSP